METANVLHFVQSFCLGLMLAARSSPLVAQQVAGPVEEPEEILVIGNRQLMALRLGMLDAERAAYEVFNHFNDEKRFDIRCGMRQPTGSRLAIQVCEPEFEIQAKRTHARSYVNNMRDWYDQLARGIPQPSENYPPVHVPAEMAIASQQKAYRAKMRQVAEQHPEFLAALVKYAEARKRYEDAMGKARQ